MRSIAGLLSWTSYLWRWSRVITLASLPKLVRLLRSTWQAPTADTANLALDLKLRNSQRKLWARMHASDVKAFEEIFGGGVYDGLRQSVAKVQYIIDCGANVGYSSAYFLDCFPRSQVVALEPDPGNARLCQANLAEDIGNKRAVVYRAALWSTERTLSISHDGEEWGRTVSEPDGDQSSREFEVPAYSLAALVKMSGFPYIDILKIDIEGAEREVFGKGTSRELLQSVGMIAIELHGPDCEQAFHSALQGLNFEISRSSAYTLALNRDYSRHEQPHTTAEQAHCSNE